MSDMLTTGISALMAFRQALDTVGHNISNASTTGYSRERVDLTAQPFGGVTVRQIGRLTDTNIFARSLQDGSSLARLDTFQTLASRVDGLMSQPETGIAQPLQQFFAAVDGVSSDPQSAAARQNLLATAQNLIQRFKDLQGQFNSTETDINNQMSQSVFDVNTLTKNIADLNNRIALNASGSAQPPNDLLDQRDTLITQLSKNIGITTVRQDDGSVNVFTASGQALVIGASTQKLSLVGSVYDSSRLEVAVGSPPININTQVSGGLIGGLLDARSQLLDPTESRLGRIAAALSIAFNDQHVQGMDQNGQLGGLFFNQVSGTASAATTNAGSASVSVELSNIGQVTGDNYRLSYNGSVWSLNDASTGAVIPMTGSGTGIDPFIAAGLSLQVSGSAAAGDSYRIEPTLNIAGQLSLAISSPAKIAAATPVRASAILGNSGSGTIAVSGINDVTNPALLSPVTIQFTSASTYSVNGSGSFAYTPDATISINGWNAVISGTPATGDSFQIKAGAINSADNGNAKLLGAVGSKALLDGGNSSIIAVNTALVSQTGNLAQQASLRRDAAQAIQVQTQKDRDAVSGVNLDEEAADLVRYQQAYQAAAQIISTAQTTFQALLNAARG